jgi:septal ring factor EnvC (AmiA/AmiB activator)
MKKPAMIAAALILTVSLCAGVIAQTSPSSTPANTSPAANSQLHELADELTPDQTIALLVADLKDLRGILETTKAERDSAVTALETEKAERASLERSYASAEKQIATLNRSIDHLERAIALHEKTIALVEKQRDDATAEAKRSKKHAAIAAIIAAASVLRLIGIF